MPTKIQSLSLLIGCGRWQEHELWLFWFQFHWFLNKLCLCPLGSLFTWIKRFPFVGQEEGQTGSLSLTTTTTKLLEKHQHLLGGKNSSLCPLPSLSSTCAGGDREKDSERDGDIKTDRIVRYGEGGGLLQKDTQGEITLRLFRQP